MLGNIGRDFQAFGLPVVVPCQDFGKAIGPAICDRSHEILGIGVVVFPKGRFDFVVGRFDFIHAPAEHPKGAGIEKIGNAILFDDLGIVFGNEHNVYRNTLR